MTDDASALDPQALDRAARWITEADALVISAGAGMGVDSGLPDFRGNQGFWNAYPPYQKLGVSFMDMANPSGFAADPPFAWGFYGHRLHLYRDTVPHGGFQRLREWAARCREGSFVFTSNIDGAFQKAGFASDAVVECHGSLHWLQCQEPCGPGIWTADLTEVAVDLDTMRAQGSLPTCEGCGSVARPNVLMFGDWHWIASRTGEQEQRLQAWLAAIEGAIVVVECGAGTAIPSVRSMGEALVRRRDAKLIRINPREPQVPAGQIGLRGGARITLEALDRRLGEL